MNIDTAVVSWDRMVDVWMGWLMWLLSPGMPNRTALVAVLVFILCYVAGIAAKFGGDDENPFASYYTEEN